MRESTKKGPWDPGTGPWEKRGTHHRPGGSRRGAGSHSSREERKPRGVRAERVLQVPSENMRPEGCQRNWSKAQKGEKKAEAIFNSKKNKKLSKKGN